MQATFYQPRAVLISGWKRNAHPDNENPTCGAAEWTSWRLDGLYLRGLDTELLSVPRFSRTKSTQMSPVWTKVREFLTI